MGFRGAKIKSILVFSVVCALLLVNCTPKPKTVKERLMGKWLLGIESSNPKDATDAAAGKIKTVTVTFGNKACAYDFLTNEVSERKEVFYYLLLNNETVLAIYYDELFVEMQEQFDIVKLSDNEMILKERKVDGKKLMLFRYSD